MPGDEVQGPGEGHPLLQGLEGGSLDGGPVGKRVTERNADFDDVRDLGGGRNAAGLPHAGVAGGEVGNQRRAARGVECGPARREPGLRQSSRQPSVQIGQGS